MQIALFIIGLLLALATLVDGFETILLPRRINHRFRYSRFYYRGAWQIWRGIAGRFPNPRWREASLGIFGPLSLLGLFGSWIACLIFSFALMQSSLAALEWTGANPEPARSFATDIYYSGTTYFTLGLGDVAPASEASRAFTVAEVGVGFGFFAIIISYLPVLYQAFSKRELTISLMDARAGSPPTAGEFVHRLAQSGTLVIDHDTLRSWEKWCAELLESHLSFPVLAYYRSQHANQSWLAALTAMLDSSALLMTLSPADRALQAQMTFAMARHAAVDIALIFKVAPTDQLQRAAIEQLQIESLLGKIGRPIEESPALVARLTELRNMYEPFLQALSIHFRLPLPAVISEIRIADNWQRSSWMPRTPGIGNLPTGDRGSDDHFDN